MNRVPCVDAALAILAAGGCQGSVILTRSDKWEARVRRGSTEGIESANSASLHLRAYAPGGRTMSASTSDLRSESVRRTAEAAVETAALLPSDEWAGLPSPAECGVPDEPLDLEDPGFAGLDREVLVQKAIDAESVAFACDRRILNSDGCSCHAVRKEVVLATTDGFHLNKAATTFGYGTVVVAEDHGEKQRGGWSTTARRLADLSPPEAVGSEAARRCVRGFGWTRIASGRLPVMLDASAASSWLGLLAAALEGSNVYRGRTWLASSLGEGIASSLFTIEDNPLLPGGNGSRPWDAEGVRARIIRPIERGRLQSWFVDSYAARRLGHAYTGHAGGTSNLRVIPGTKSSAELTAAMGAGLLVTDLSGSGIDVASGRMSCGVKGFRVQGGVLGQPVQGVTIAGNLREMLQGIRLIGNDPLPARRISSPSLLFDELTIGGKEK